MTATLECLRVEPGDEAFGLSPVLAESMVVSASGAGGAVGCDHRPTLALVRRQRPYALLGPRDLRLPRVGDGVAFLERRGLPAFARIGGGSLVVLDDDCLSFALAWRCRNPTHVGLAVRGLAAPALAALARLGVAARMGAAPGSYCEGPSDLVAPDGRKIAGIAAALRGGWALVSGMLLVRQDPAYATGVVAGFEAVAGGNRRYDAGAVTNLERVLGRPLAVESVAAALIAALGHWADAEGATAVERSPRAAELAIARVLFERRRVRPSAMGGKIGRAATGLAQSRT